MNVYLAFGTGAYLQKMKEQHSDLKKLFLLFSSGSSVLLHETEAKSFFSTGKAFEVIDAAGGYEDAGFAVMNNIPVQRDERAVFESRFKERAGLVEKEPGCKGIRILRPKDDDTYVVLTLWKKKKDFENWQESDSYKEAHKNRNTSNGLPSTVFSGKPYIRTYFISDDEEV
ncbi:antibiotic biosynthesis monooxygenase family protein [Pseudalkalibacillus caeni]|uniref:Antibiotic biosynthesis monooxygenase n=1 Tax=Exobacillus caeni TaxID=2574798 RepID=A0A5R9FB12_9BACL|nr:antibiotic biosynthesis monooxygenase [Pseudalkalibacillus caeni]TLS38073.1 antibiotic biosynthesis monooxygenase [Pseudalkalibacillus caeni]